MEEEAHEEVYEVELIYDYFFQHLRLSKLLIVSQKFGKQPRSGLEGNIF